jgi:hypothetical protein
MSNHAVGVRRGGEIWLSMAREIYVEPGRKMKGIGSQGQMSTIELMRPVMSEDGEVEHENDLSEAEFDLAVEVGPSSSSKRAATVRSLTAMMAVTQDPDALRVLQAAALMNMEGEGLTEISDHFRRQLVQMGVIKPTDEEAAQMAQAGSNPDPNAIFLQAAAEEAQAKAAKARADVVATVADAELTQAKTMETLAKVGGEVEGAMMQPQPAPTPEPAAPQMDPFEAAKRELELENMRMDNAAKFAALAKALKQQQAEEESGSEEESSADESDDKVSETLDELKSMVESLARQVADMRPQQPIIVSTGGGGKKIQITKTSTGFSGEVVNEE